MRDFFIAKISQARSESNDTALQMAYASLATKIDLFRVAAYDRAKRRLVNRCLAGAAGLLERREVGVMVDSVIMSIPLQLSCFGVKKNLIKIGLR